MGNGPSASTDTITIPGWERNLHKNYNCHYYIISSDPNLFQTRKCLVLDHSENKLYYTLKDLELDLIYENVPSVFVSSSRINYSWDSYFKIGTVVKTNATMIDKSTMNGKFKGRARISDIKMDTEKGVAVDLVDLRTNYRAYGVPPSEFALDKEYYRIK